MIRAGYLGNMSGLAMYGQELLQNAEDRAQAINATITALTTHGVLTDHVNVLQGPLKALLMECRQLTRH